MDLVFVLGGLLLSACTANFLSAPTPPVQIDALLTQDWVPFEHKEFGISFLHPVSYTAQETEDGEIFIAPYLIPIRQLMLEGASGALISIINSKRNNIMQYVEQYQPSQNYTLSGSTWQRYRFKDTGNTVGFLLHTKPPYVLMEFSVPPSEEVINRVLQSVNLSR